MTGRDRTCDAPRFKRALYRLSYGHVGASLSIPSVKRIDAQAHMSPGKPSAMTYDAFGSFPNAVVQASRPLFDPGSRAVVIDGAVSYVGERRSPALSVTFRNQAGVTVT